ncbi:MAG: RING finger protein [Oscillospiraceae bacterium]
MANKFIGSKCLVCEEVFKEGDDVVVCPDCGTPYHRECWKSSNKCINDELHETGESWQPDSEKVDSSQQIRCMRCGTVNTLGQKFCGECGLPLMTGSDDERPFPNAAGNMQNNAAGQYGAPGNFGPYPNRNMNNNQFNGAGFGGMSVQQIKLTEESDINGIRLGDFFEYTGRKSLSIIANFVKFAKTGSKISFNIAALFFPEYYFFYRKMNKKGILFFIITFLLSIPSLIYYGQSGDFGMVLFHTTINIKGTAFLTIMNVCSLASTLMSVITGLFANYWYYQKARTDILSVRAGDCADEQAIKERIRIKGGTSWKNVIAAAVLTFIFSLGFWLAMTAVF